MTKTTATSRGPPLVYVAYHIQFGLDSSRVCAGMQRGVFSLITCFCVISSDFGGLHKTKQVYLTLYENVGTSCVAND